ncbi:MAG TPA: hypothetical protein VFW00_10670 [Rhodocyclaceae bacterium]|nr:hypothetical protein [Rhodocyclaceae bacterium]
MTTRSVLKIAAVGTCVSFAMLPLTFTQAAQYGDRTLIAQSNSGSDNSSNSGGSAGDKNGDQRDDFKDLRFSDVDKNHDGYIDSQEGLAAQIDGTALQKMDTNRDKKISPSEFSAYRSSADAKASTKPGPLNSNTMTK